MQINKNMLIGEILELDVETAPFFFEMGMHCLGCAIAHGETIAEAAEVHGIDLEKLLEDLNK